MDTTLIVAIATLLALVVLVLASVWIARRRARAANNILANQDHAVRPTGFQRVAPDYWDGYGAGAGRVGAKSSTQPGRTLQNRTQDDAPASTGFEYQAVADMLAMEQQAAAPAPAAEFHGGGGDFGGSGASGTWDSASPASDTAPDCSSSDTNCASSD